MGGSEEIATQVEDAQEEDRTRTAICLVSGGMDSCVTAAIAHNENDELAFLHVSHYDVKLRLVISLEHLARIGGSSLTDPAIAVTPADLASQSIPSSYVPFRNAHLLAAAVSWGEVIGANAIYIGAVAEDSSGYPDCRPEFYAAFQSVIDLGTKPETNLLIKTPVIGMKKLEIVRKGLELEAPLQLTWSCYQSSDLACGNCDSCALRLRAFREAGVPDPIPYQLDSNRFAY
jgi:7-cyano-7-deazaguanine synthase